MGCRNVILEKAFSVAVKNNCLLIDGEHSLPTEDINALLLENRACTVSAAALAKLVQDGAAVFICDDKHLPCAVMLPFAQHYLQTEMAKAQESLSVPDKKRLWQQIIVAKITNQAKCLELLERTEEAAALRRLAGTVNSGDTKNVEASAARQYFQYLFADGEKFKRGGRGDREPRNAALNYGYSVMRGQVARLLAAYGFMTFKGLHHRSEYNSFNLADDLMEPLRPIVDLFTALHFKNNISAELNPELKRGLFNLLGAEVESGGQKHSVSYAAERLVQSFSRCCYRLDRDLLLPVLVPLKQHRYE